MAVAVLDRKAQFEQLVHSHQKGVWRYLRFLGASAAEADDLTQETFLAAWRAGFTQISPAATSAYLRTVARSRFLMMVRTRKRRITESELADVEADWIALTNEGDDWDDRMEVVDRCLQGVQGRAREALDLFYRQGRSYAEIAPRLELKPEGVKTLVRRVVEKLRQCMEAKLKWPAEENA